MIFSVPIQEKSFKIFVRIPHSAVEETQTSRKFFSLNLKLLLKSRSTEKELSKALKIDKVV